MSKSGSSLSRIHAMEVERLNPKPLNVSSTGPERLEVKPLHLSLSRGQTSSIVSLRLSHRGPVS